MNPPACRPMRLPRQEIKQKVCLSQDIPVQQFVSKEKHEWHNGEATVPERIVDATIPFTHRNQPSPILFRQQRREQWIVCLVPIKSAPSIPRCRASTLRVSNGVPTSIAVVEKYQRSVAPTSHMSAGSRASPWVTSAKVIHNGERVARARRPSRPSCSAEPW